jgi:protein-L-isoaspartate(D-aspartate) O-methyltransferase
MDRTPFAARQARSNSVKKKGSRTVSFVRAASIATLENSISKHLEAPQSNTRCVVAEISDVSEAGGSSTCESGLRDVDCAPVVRTVQERSKNDPRTIQERSKKRREFVVARQMAARGVRDSRMLDARRTVPRDEFVPDPVREFAYEDGPLSIGAGQTISQPFIVALMTKALELQPDDRVLKIGAGSGYAAAVLGHLAAEVHTVERHPALAERARTRMERLGLEHVHVHEGDGTLGWPEGAPYQAIVVTAGGPAGPESLTDQLEVGGRLVIPVGDTLRSQELVRLTRTGEKSWERRVLIRGQVRAAGGPTRLDGERRATRRPGPPRPGGGQRGVGHGVGSGAARGEQGSPLAGRTRQQGWTEKGERPVARARRAQEEGNAALGTGSAPARPAASKGPPSPAEPATLARLITEAAEPIEDIDETNIDALL